MPRHGPDKASVEQCTYILKGRNEKELGISRFTSNTNNKEDDIHARSSQKRGKKKVSVHAPQPER